MNQENSTAPNGEPDNGKCKACLGLGVQLSVLDGLKHVCPSCEGTGIYFAKGVWIPQPIWYWNPQQIPTWTWPVITCVSSASPPRCSATTAFCHGIPPDGEAQQ